MHLAAEVLLATRCVHIVAHVKPKKNRAGWLSAHTCGEGERAHGPSTVAPGSAVVVSQKKKKKKGSCSSRYVTKLYSFLCCSVLLFFQVLS